MKNEVKKINYIEESRAGYSQKFVGHYIDKNLSFKVKYRANDGVFIRCIFYYDVLRKKIQ